MRTPVRKSRSAAKNTPTTDRSPKKNSSISSVHSSGTECGCAALCFPTSIDSVSEANTINTSRETASSTNSDLNLENENEKDNIIYNNIYSLTAPAIPGTTGKPKRTPVKSGSIKLDQADVAAFDATQGGEIGEFSPPSKPRSEMSPSEKRAYTMQLKHQALIEKARLKARSQKKITKSPDTMEVREMAYAYEEILGEFLHAPAFRYLKGKLDPSHRSFAQFKKAAKLAKEAGVSAKTFVKAQFYWFDHWFNRAPKPYELCGKSVERLEQYQQLIESGKISGGKVQSIAILSRITPQQLDKINQRRLDELQQVWGLSETEVFERFACKGADYFDQAWLRNHPTYRKLKKDGKL